MKEGPNLVVELAGPFDAAEVPDARQDDETRPANAHIQGPANLNG
jgi:hypothetical protein